MTGHVVDDSKARAFVKVMLPESMRMPNIPAFERLGFNSAQNARDAVNYFLKAGIQARME